MAVIDGMMKVLVSQLGITPQHIEQAMGLLKGIGQDRDAFKKGSAAVVADFTVRLDRMDAALARIERATTQKDVTNGKRYDHAVSAIAHDRDGGNTPAD
jgi:hypothetical protein